MATFSGGYLVDPDTGRPVVGAPVAVTDYATGASIAPDGGVLATGPHGGYGRFTVADVDVVVLRAGGVEQIVVSVEKQLEALPDDPPGGMVHVGAIAPHDGLWLDTSNTPQPVTAPPPTFTDADGTANDTYTIPSMSGVEYLVDGSVRPAGTYPASGTVTVTARAMTGYYLSGTSSWSHTFGTGTAPVSVTANEPTADDAANTITWTPKTGVEYVIGGAVRTPPYSVGDVDATVAVTAQATTGYTLTGTSSWTFTFTTTPIPSGAYSTAVLADSPHLYIPLDDAPGTTSPLVQGQYAAFNTFGIGAAGATFGQPGIGAGTTSVSLPGGATSMIQLSGAKVTKDASNNGAFWGHSRAAMEILVKPGSGDLMIGLGGGAGSLLGATGAGSITARWGGVAASTTVSDWTARRLLAFRWDGSDLILYVNGTEAARTALTTPSINLDLRLTIGNTASGLGSVTGPHRLAGAAIWVGTSDSDIPTPARFLAHAQAAGLA